MHCLPGLDLLRAIAIVWVLLFHAYALFGLGLDFAWLSNHGWMGVDIFFVLSGFLIGTQVLRPLQRGERLSFGGFYARRAWRILPAFAVVLVLYLGFPALREAPGMAPWWKFVTFTMNLSIDYRHEQAFSQAWSLCVEEHFYLIFPLLAWWLTRKPSAGKIVAVCAGVVLLGVVLRGAVWWHDASISSSRNWYVEDIYYPSWMRLDGLLMGVVLAVVRVYRPQLWSRWQVRANVVLLVGIALSGVALWLFRDRTGLLANTVGWPLLSCGFGLVVFAGADRRSLIGRWKVPGAGWVAAISYSLYLSHKIALHLVQVTYGVLLQGHGIWTFAAYALAIALLGSALHYLVERPFLRQRDRQRDRRLARGRVATANAAQDAVI